MTTASRFLGFALFATLLTTACDQRSDSDDVARLAVVMVADDGLEQVVGSYDVETGELTFVPQMQDEMRDVIDGNGYRAIVAHDGEGADVDLDAGVAVMTAELEDGDVLELQANRSDVGTSTIGRLELRADSEDAFRGIWKEGNVAGMDDWEKHNV